jgi:ketosteroid isomerase-like protein
MVRFPAVRSLRPASNGYHGDGRLPVIRRRRRAAILTWQPANENRSSGALLRMTRFLACLSALLPVCCVSIAQNPAPATAPITSSAATADSPEIRQFQKVEDSWSEAINNRDQYALELVLSPLLVDVSATGDITTRNQQVALTLNGEDKTVHLDQRVITVRMLGDLAVANGTYTLHHKVGTAEVNEKGIFTHVFQRSHSAWLCINSQRTVLREESNAKQKKQSTAELPFHVPLFSKGDKGPQ